MECKVGKVEYRGMEQRSNLSMWDEFCLKGVLTTNFGTVRNSKLISLKFDMELHFLLHRKNSHSVLMLLPRDAYKTHKYMGFIATAYLAYSSHSHY